MSKLHIFSGSFSRYWNENLFKKKMHFLPKYVQKSSFYPSIYVHNSHVTCRYYICK